MAQKIKVIVSETARRDLSDILEYISLDSPRLAKKMIQKLLKDLKKLPSHPRSGRVIPEIGDSCLREIIVTPYRLMYRLEEGKLILLRVLHGKRLFEGEI